jgi:parallel beta-helix repeat protein
LFENNTVCTNRLSDILFRGTSEGNEGDNTCNVLDDTEEDMNMEVTCSITCPYYGNCGDEIDGDIVLARDIEDCEDGLIVTTDNIVIDCNGYRIYGDGINGGIGILVDSLDNITIKNWTIKYFGVGIALFNSNSSTLMSNYMDSNGMGGETGIYMFNSNYTTVENNLVENDDGTGINLEFGFLNTLTNNTLLNNLYGIYLISSHNNTLTDNTANENVFGIDLGNSANNTLSGNTANKNIVVGVYLTGTSTNNYLIENTVNQNIGETYGILLSEGADENTLINNTIIGNTAGMNVGSLNNTLIDNFACANIVDIIDYTDGNDWTRTTYTFSDPVNTTYFDQLATCPFIQGLCGQTVTESVTLTEDIVCEEGDIFSPRPTALVIGANNLTIDCDGNYLIGYADYAGILSSGYNNTEIINCDISGFFYGIYFEDSNNSIVEDSNLHENMCEGMYIYSSSEDPYHAYVYDTVFEDNYQECVLTGLYLSSSTLFMWNSEFINNGEYGLYEEFRGIPDTVYWTIDDYAYCKDNGIYISTADGYITFDEGVLEIDNCTIEIYNRETETWAIWSIEGNMTDYIPEREVEANESEEFVFENSDAIITLELNETTNISFFVGLLNAGQLEALGDSPTGLIPFKGINVEINENEINGTITICITYTDDELDDAGIEEDTLVMYYFNETSDEWEIITLQRQGSNRVCAEIPHFSIYALFGEKTEEDGGSPRGSSYTGGGARPVGQSPITTEEEEEELQIDEEELEEEIIVPEKPSEEIPDEKPIDTTKPYVPPTIEEQQEESDFTGIYIVAGIIIIAGIIYWWMTAAKAGKKGLMRFK